MEFSLLGFSGLREVYNVHPAFVHFPIALIPAALLFYFFGVVLRRTGGLVAGRGCLLLGLASGALTVWTGLRAADSIPHNDSIHALMETHEHIGLTIAGLLVLLGAWSFLKSGQRPRAAGAFLVVLAFTTYLVLQNGDIGGRMVFLHGAAVKAAVPVITPPDDAAPAHRHGDPVHH